MTRCLVRLSLLTPIVAVSLTLIAGRVEGQATSSRLPERAVRRDIPITNAIRRAYTAGTRDSTGRPGRNYWQLRTDYTISARLDASDVPHNRARDSRRSQHESRLARSDHAATGSEHLPRQHASNGAMGAGRGDGRDGDHAHVGGWPGRESRAAAGRYVRRCARRSGCGDRAGGSGAEPADRPRASNDAGAGDLPTKIPPRATTTLEIEWNHKLPGGPGSGHRMTQRWADTLYQPTQWFPRVAVYDDLRGWDPELYLGPSEFYNNFGRFDVRIDVPAGWIVSGTGVLQNPRAGAHA